MARARERMVAVLPLALLAAFAVLLVRTAWISDDAYITLRTVDNFVHGLGLRWNVAERVQTFTHPLWLFVLAGPYACTREPYHTTLILCLLVSLAAVSLAAWRSRSDPVGALGILSLLLLSKAFVDYSTSGLENPMTHLLLAAFVVAVPAQRACPGRLMLLALLTSLCALNRPDAMLLVAPALALLLWQSWSGKAAGCTALGLSPLLFWTLFAIVYYGSAVPNTARAKLGSGVPATELAIQGLHYLVNSLQTDPVTLVATVSGVVLAVRSRRALDLALAAGVVAYLVFVVRIGGDFMSGRYLTAPLFLALMLPSAPRDRSQPRVRIVTLLLVLLGLARAPSTLLSGPDRGLDHTALLDVHGIADERSYYFPASGLLNGAGEKPRPASADTRQGSELRRCKVPLTVAGAVGFLGFHAGPAVHVVDVHALGDPFLSRLPMAERDPEYEVFRRELDLPPSRNGWRIGHFIRVLPPGYIESLATGRNVVAAPRLARLWEDVAMVTRGDLFTGDRWRAILRLGPFGADATREPRSGIPVFDWAALTRAQPGNPEWRFRAANQWLNAGRADLALPALQLLVADAPCLLRPRLALARSLAGVGRLEDALEVLDAAARGAPEDPVVWGEQASMLELAGRSGEAIEAWERLIALDRSQLVPVRVRIAGIQEAAGDEAAAAANREAAERAAPRSVEVALMRARSLARSGHVPQAIQTLEVVRRRYPRSERLTAALAALRGWTSGPRER